MVYFPNGRGDGNTNSLKDLAACIPAFRSQGSGFPVIFDDYPLAGREIVFDVGPSKTVSGVVKASIQLLWFIRPLVEDYALDGFLSSPAIFNDPQILTATGFLDSYKQGYLL
jgi:hypothetical protein